MKQIFLVIFSFILLPLYGQVKTDSLLKIWQNTSLSDSARISSINTLAWEGYLFTLPDSAYYFAQLHYNFAKEKGLKKEMAIARNTQGTSFYMLGNHAKAIDFFYQSLHIKEDIKDYKGIAATLNNIGMIYDEQKDYDKAIGHYTRAIKNFHKIEEKKDADYQVIVASYHNLGVLYFDIGNLKEAMVYFNKTLELTSETKFLRERAYTFSNLGQIFLGQKDLKKSMEYFNKAYEIEKKIGDENGMINELNNFSLLSIEQKNYSKAVYYATEALKMAQRNNSTLQIKEAAESLYLSYKELGNYNKALGMYELYNSARDSIQSYKNKNEVIRQEFKYTYERQAAADSIAYATTQQIQNLKIAEQQTQLKSEKTQRVLLYCILVLLAVLIFVGYRGYKRQNKANTIITNQKREVEKQRDMIAGQHALLEEKSRKIIEFNTTLETLVAQRTRELENSLHQIRNYQFNLAHKIRAPYVTLVGLLNLVRDERFDSAENKKVLQNMDETSKRIAVVLQDISEELNRFEGES